MYLQDEIKEHRSPRKYSQLDFQDGYSLDHFPSSSNVYLCEINDLDTSNLSAKTVIEVEQDNLKDSSKRCNKQGLYYRDCIANAICAENSSSQINLTAQNPLNQSIEKGKLIAVSILNYVPSILI